LFHFINLISLVSSVHGKHSTLQHYGRLRYVVHPVMSIVDIRPMKPPFQLARAR